MAAFDDIISVVIIYFTHDFWTKVLEGLTVAAVIEGLKNLFGQFKKIMQSKKLYKTTADKVSEKQPTISKKGPNINIVLPVGVSDEKFNYCIDKSFESVKDAAPLIKKKETITFYDDSTGNVFTYTVEEYYWKKVVSPQGQEDDTRLFEED